MQIGEDDGHWGETQIEQYRWQRIFAVPGLEVVAAAVVKLDR